MSTRYSSRHTSLSYTENFRFQVISSDISARLTTTLACGEAVDVFAPVVVMKRWLFSHSHRIINSYSPRCRRRHLSTTPRSCTSSHEFFHLYSKQRNIGVIWQHIYIHIAVKLYLPHIRASGAPSLSIIIIFYAHKHSTYQLKYRIHKNRNEQLVQV